MTLRKMNIMLLVFVLIENNNYDINYFELMMEVYRLDRFLGVGLVNAVGIAIFVMLFIVCMKIIFAKWEVPGITDVVMSV